MKVNELTRSLPASHMCDATIFHKKPASFSLRDDKHFFFYHVYIIKLFYTIT